MSLADALFAVLQESILIPEVQTFHKDIATRIDSTCFVIVDEGIEILADTGGMINQAVKQTVDIGVIYKIGDSLKKDVEVSCNAVGNMVISILRSNPKLMSGQFPLGFCVKSMSREVYNNKFSPFGSNAVFQAISFTGQFFRRSV